MINISSLIIPLVVLLPNLFFFQTNSQGDLKRGEYEGNDNKNILTLLEEVGRLSVFILPVFYKISLDSRLDILALMGMAVFLTLYYLGWIRYFKKDMRELYLFAPLFKIPVPMAISPVLYFGLASIILDSYLLSIATTILGISHIPLSLKEYRLLNN